MIIIKQLTTPELIDKAGALLHRTYIEQQKWNFSPDTPSKLRVEVKSDQKILVDRFTEQAIWFGAMDGEELVGCLRLHSLDENNQLELETYPSTRSILKYIPQQDKHLCFEVTKMTTRQDYIGRGIVKRLFLTCFKYCEEQHYSIIACTHNGYLKALFKKIGLPLKKEHAFKYEEHDTSAVNFYFADYNKGEVAEATKKLEDLTSNLSGNAAKIFRALETVESILPTPFYWMDANGVVLGINDLCLKAIGSSREIIGKKPYEFYKKEIADHILRHNAEVIRRGEILSQEEWIEDLTTKKMKCFSSIKAPLYDDEGTVIGIVGSSVEVTAEKEAEELKLENEAHKVKIEEHEKLINLAKKVSHDIRAPAKTVIEIAKACKEIPEALRVALGDAGESITNIADNLLNQYEGKDIAEEGKKQPILLSAFLSRLLARKKLEYKNLAIKFDYKFSSAGNFAFIKAPPNELERSMSNIINNAVGAFKEGKGNVTIQLDTTNAQVKIIIQDNGQGMPQEVADKIMNNVVVTHGKVDGHGIGLQVVRDTLRANQGELAIDSVLGKGTSIALTFPRVKAPSWIAEEIKLGPTAIIVILDDDTSIHAVWDMHFEEILAQYPEMQLEHFEEGAKVLEFIKSLRLSDKRKVFLLTDFELLNQNITGLDIIAQSGVEHSVLVTSHYAEKEVQAKAAETGTKILSKELASEVPVIVDGTIKYDELIQNESKKVDLVLIDDDESFAKIVMLTTFIDLIVDHHTSPTQFLKHAVRYAKDTKICVDKNFAGSDMDGLDLAKTLHDKGYTRIFLVSGEQFNVGELPEYVVSVGKMEIDKIKYM